MNPELPEGYTPDANQLDRIERKVDLLVARVAKVESKASFWGAVGGGMALLVTKLAGCM
jgi:hypothetical protein